MGQLKKTALGSEADIKDLLSGRFHTPEHVALKT